MSLASDKNAPLEHSLRMLDNAKMRVGSFGNMNIEVVRRDEAEAILRDALRPVVLASLRQECPGIEKCLRAACMNAERCVEQPSPASHVDAPDAKDLRIRHWLQRATAAEGAIADHNHGLLEACGKTTSHQSVKDSRRCDERRDCSDCPKDWRIDVAPPSSELPNTTPQGSVEIAGTPVAAPEAPAVPSSTRPISYESVRAMQISPDGLRVTGNVSVAAASDTPETDAFFGTLIGRHSPEAKMVERLERERNEARKLAESWQQQASLWQQKAPESARAPQWIACSERLPVNGSVFAAGKDADGNWWREVCSASWVRDQQHFATHWMPLPSAPTDGTAKP